MPDASGLLHMNLHVFSERDPEKRREAIERTYVEDVRFIDQTEKPGAGSAQRPRPEDS